MPVTERAAALSAVGFAKETTFGTPVAATTFVPATNITLNPDPGLFFPEVMMGQRERQVFPLYGQAKFVGGVEFPLFPTMGVDLLVGAIGSDTLTGSSDPYTHTINPANTLFSYTFEKNIGGAQSEQYAGFRVNKYELKATSGDEAAMCTVDGIAQSVAVLASPTAVNITNESPYVFAEATLTALGASRIDATSVTMTLENNLKATYTLAQSANAQFITPLARKVSGQISVVWSSLNDATYGYLQKMPVGGGTATVGTLVLLLAHAGSPSRSVQITLNQIQLSKLADDLKMADVVMATLDYEASYVIGSSLLQAVVKNSKSTAY